VWSKPDERFSCEAKHHCLVLCLDEHVDEVEVMSSCACASLLQCQLAASNKSLASAPFLSSSLLRLLV